MKYVKEIRKTFKTCLLNATVEVVVRVHDLMTHISHTYWYKWWQRMRLELDMCDMPWP